MRRCRFRHPRRSRPRFGRARLTKDNEHRRVQLRVREGKIPGDFQLRQDRRGRPTPNHATRAASLFPGPRVGRSPAPQPVRDPPDLGVARHAVGEARRPDRLAGRQHGRAGLHQSLQLPRGRERKAIAARQNKQPVAHAVRKQDTTALHPRPRHQHLVSHHVVIIALGRRGPHARGRDLQRRVVAEMIQQIRRRAPLLQKR